MAHRLGEIMTPFPKRRVTIDELEDGTVTVLVEKRGDENAAAWRLTPKDGAELLEQLRQWTPIL